MLEFKLSQETLKEAPCAYNVIASLCASNELHRGDPSASRACGGFEKGKRGLQLAREGTSLPRVLSSVSRESESESES